VQEWAATA